VTVRGDAARLTRLEMKLLEYFVENEGRVIPRKELLENVWGMPGYLNTRAPDQFIRRLRKIFEPDPANPRHFLTIRDAGYRFVAAGEEAAREK
jgi:two-component system alkaline phosphatase synthesis response regulator PhoP